MRKNTLALVACLVSMFLTVSTYSQPRTSGRAVVPIGFEYSDSIRFGMFQGMGARQYMTGMAWTLGGDSGSNSRTNAYFDSMQANAEHEFGDYDSGAVFGTKRKLFSGNRIDGFNFFAPFLFALNQVAL